MININKINEQSGRSMVEMLGVLAIVGVLSIGGIAGYSKAMAKYKINKTLDQVSMIITNVRTTFGNQTSYRGLNTTSAITYELVGADLTLGSTSKLTNSFNGEVKITAGDTVGVKCDADGSTLASYCPTFTVSFAGLDTAACAAIASADWGGTASSGLLAIQINTDGEAKDGVTGYTTTATGGDGLHVWTGTGVASRLPIDYAEAADECSSTTSQNVITWLYN